MLQTVVTAVFQVQMNPTYNGLPGASAMQTITNGIGAWGLLLALAGLVIGAAVWAVGAHSQNYQHAMAGRRAVLVSGLAALVIGAAPAIVNFFFATGQQIPVHG